jgi:uncharacterized protein (DUF433 family)
MAVEKLENQAQADVEQEIRRLRRLAKTAPPITSNPERMGGTPVIGLSRVPVATLLDCLADGESLGEFVENYPSVSREEVVKALDRLKQALTEGLIAEAVDY